MKQMSSGEASSMAFYISCGWIIVTGQLASGLVLWVVLLMAILISDPQNPNRWF